MGILQKNPPKYHNIKTVIDGVTFDSRKEANYYIHLKIRAARGEIKNLSLQPKYPVVINGYKICTYRADFTYLEGNKTIVIDVKGFITPIYRLKKKLVQAIYDIEVVEV